MTIWLREQGDGAEGRAMLVIELASRMDKPHGGFSAVDNRNTFEFAFHGISDRQFLTLLFNVRQR
jgi:hypothetical protein